MEALFTLEKIEKAYRTCRRRKRGTLNALRFEENLLDNFCDLQEELVARAYHPSSSICFVQKRPKLREIFAADFRDRVVHHLLVGYLEPIFERIFIHDSYACRRHKGVHAAVTRLRRFLGQVSANGTRRAWYLKADVAGFFMNVDREILYRLISKKIKREDVRWLARVMILHDCTKDYRFKGNPGLLDRIPPHKTLFKVTPGKGLPIGNLSSQFFANVYLNELDQFVKRRLKCRYYIRYCDDFLLLDRSPAKLSEWRAEIEAFLREKLLLQPNESQGRLCPVSSGIDFLGYIVRRRYVLVRSRVVNHFREKLEEFDNRLGETSFVGSKRRRLSVVGKGRGGSPLVGRMNPHLQDCAEEKGIRKITAWQYPPETMNALRATTASYLGHFSWANTHRLVQKLFAKHAVLRAAFTLRNGGLIPRYAPRGKRENLRSSYRWWAPEKGAAALPGIPGNLYPLWTGGDIETKVLIFFPVGSFYEFYGYQARLGQEVLGLKPVTGLRGFREGCGFHRRWLGRFLIKALNAGYHVALIRAERGLDGRVRRRLARLFREKGIVGQAFQP